MDHTRWDRASATLQPDPIASPQHDNGPSNFHKWAKVNFQRWAKVSCQTQIASVLKEASFPSLLPAGGIDVKTRLSPIRELRGRKAIS